MQRNTTNHKAIKNKLVKVKPPANSPLPFNGEKVKDGGFSFSFACLDRNHEFFNLGGKNEDGTIGGQWFLALLDCLKSVSGKTIQELKNSIHDLHPVKWETANVRCPSQQGEYWQFRISKSKGRVIGLLIDSVFYVVWLDPYHNLTNSEGYGEPKIFDHP